MEGIGNRGFVHSSWIERGVWSREEGGDVMDSSERLPPHLLEASGIGSCNLTIIKISNRRHMLKEAENKY